MLEKLHAEKLHFREKESSRLNLAGEEINADQNVVRKFRHLIFLLTESDI